MDGAAVGAHLRLGTASHPMHFLARWQGERAPLLPRGGSTDADLARFDGLSLGALAGAAVALHWPPLPMGLSTADSLSDQWVGVEFASKSFDMNPDALYH